MSDHLDPPTPPVACSAAGSQLQGERYKQLSVDSCGWPCYSNAASHYSQQRRGDHTAL